MKILNLYAGIGGNSDLWDREEHEITHVEYNPKIAKILQDFYPNDKIIIGDAHKYLLDHFEEFDFIWSSPPCPSHSRIRKARNDQNKPIYPDMKLYEEILLLQGYFKGVYVVENVISWYEPLKRPQEVNRHYFWANFNITKLKLPSQNINDIKKSDTIFGKNIEKYDLDQEYNHVKVLRNMVNPKLGLHIFKCAFKEQQQGLGDYTLPKGKE